MHLLIGRSAFNRPGILFRDGVHRLSGVAGEARRLFRCYATDRPLRRVLIAMMLAFSVVIVLHTLHYFAPKLDLDTGRPLVRMMSLNEEWGYGEIYAHLLCLIFVAVMIRHYARTRQRIYVALAAIFALILIDDSLQIHERIGRFLMSMTALASIPQPAIDIGQIAAFGILGVLVLAILCYGFRHSGGESARVGALLIFILCGLGFFAVMVDPLHDALEHRFAGAHLLLTVAEDGGEILMLIVACAVAFAVGRGRHGRTEDRPRHRQAAPLGRQS